MKVSKERIMMSEAAVLYYEKHYTQQEIAGIMNLSRQTVSRLLTDAVNEQIVEIIVHNPKKDCEDLQARFSRRFGLQNCLIVGVSSANEMLRRSMTIQAAAEYLTSLIKKGNQKIALSWGRTIHELIQVLPAFHTSGNVVFPLFGATDHVNLCFSSNELVRIMADKTGAEAKYAWFPYLLDSREDCEVLKRMSYYKNLQALWDNADLAVLGIGNAEVFELFEKDFGRGKKRARVAGDLATHFFDEKGAFVNLYENTLCASVENISRARQTVAIACGESKVDAISGALKTNLIDTFITDEHTARKVLEKE